MPNWFMWLLQREGLQSFSAQRISTISLIVLKTEKCTQQKAQFSRLEKSKSAEKHNEDKDSESVLGVHQY